MGREKASTVVMGEILGPHGVAGEVKVKSHLVGNLKLIKGTDLCLLFPDGTRGTKKLVGFRDTAKGPLVALEGVTDRNAAERLRGCRIEMDASLLPPVSEDEYYWRDLIGLEVFSKDGELIGEVIRLMERGEQDLLVVDIGGEEAMIPFVEPIIVSVNVKAGRMVIDPPKGLLELAGS